MYRDCLRSIRIPARSLSREYDPPGVKRHVDPHPLFRASKHHCCRGLQPDRRRPPEGDNRGRHASRRAAAAVAVHRHQISGHATDHAFDLQQLAAGAGGRKDWTVPHAIDAGDSRYDSRPLPWSSSPVGTRCERCKDYRRPSAYGCRRRHAARAEAAASVSLGFYQPASHSDFSAGFWEASQRCRDRLSSYFCLQRD
jgi:hypothetical protein